jgi:nucleotide-binding universal stress UspA family protein
VKSETVLVPLCGTPLDDDILKMAFLFAAHVADRRGKPRGKIEVIHIVEVPLTLPLDAELPDAVQRGEAILAHAEQMAHQRDIEILPEMLQARNAGTAIVDEAISRGADLVIMGAEYRRRHGEFHQGTTMPYVLKNAPCRVVVIRGAQTEAAPAK